MLPLLACSAATDKPGVKVSWIGDNSRGDIIRAWDAATNHTGLMRALPGELVIGSFHAPG